MPTLPLFSILLIILLLARGGEEAGSGPGKLETLSGSL
jgi:hypothetical protein